MSFLNKLKDTVSIADVSQKISDTTTTLKLKNQIKNNEKEIDRLSFQAGRQLVSRHLNDENSEYKEIFQEIKQLQAENSSILNELKRMEEEQKRLQQMKEEQEKLQRMKEEQERLQKAKAEQERLQQIKEEQEKLQQQKGEIQENLKPCAKCGNKNKINAKFCVYCGNPFAETPENKEEPIKTEES